MNRPNILLFLTDDHAGWSMHCAGNRELVTPNLDYLADTGVRFTNAYTPSPVCSPARASLWTGTYPSWHGVHDHLNDAGHPGIGSRPTLADALSRSGYLTAQIGKWHCHTSEDNRKRSGFDYWFSHYAGTRSRFGEQPFWEDDQRVDYHGYQAPVFTEKTLEFLGRAAAADRPFFCTVGYTDTHRPFKDAPPRILERYRHASFDDVPDETLPKCHGKLIMRLRKSEEDGLRRLRQYYAAVTMIDEQVGRILDRLVSLGLDDETLVIYTADHGQCVGHHELECKGNSTLPQSFFDESLGVPLIARWPGRFAAGTTSDAFVNHTDTYATLLEVAGSRSLDEAPRPGSSWISVARGAEAPQRDSIICEYGNARMIRTPEYKLVRRYPGPNGRFPDELYDRTADPRETQNIIGDPGVQSVLPRLDAELAAFFARYGRPESDGERVGELPLHNDKEPWRIDASFTDSAP
ncbi:MAG TPA: sulfatase-like hydrolase/transferase [Spirochaetia bacterium]|nr:sulfatase-like hydrolase/transferase [Spirochaetia bacterium]